MHSFFHRFLALLSQALTALVLMCAMASVTDYYQTYSPIAHVQVLNVHWFRRIPSKNDEVSLSLNIKADVRSLFTWNTKQVFVFVAAEYESPQNFLNQISLWDNVVSSKEDAKFWVHTSNRYRFIDQGSYLRGREFNLTLHCHVMPWAGRIYADKVVMTGYRLPEKYTD